MTGSAESAVAGRVDRAAQQRAELIDQPLHGGPVEEIGAELEHAQQAVLALPHIEHEIELRGGPLEVERRHLQARQVHRRQRCILQREHDLEQRIA